MWLWRTIARSPADSSAMADGEKVQCSVEVLPREPEVRRGDGRSEAVIEGLCQPQRFVHVIPAKLDYDLVGAQLAGVEETEHLKPVEVGLTKLAELGGAVLAHVPGVVGLLGTGRRQRQQVRRGDVSDSARRQHRLEVLEDRAGVLHVLDR